jgi:shikimate dehydrogenase
MDLLHTTDAIAAATKAVNTIRITRQRNEIELSGFNTDAYGFETSIRPFLKRDHKKALILGTGASSRTVAYVFGKLGVEYAFVSRTGKATLSYEQLNKEVISGYHLIVNTTPAGTWPEVNASPDIPYSFLSPEHLLFDLVYNPEESLFLSKGKAMGAVTLNGYEMLKHQAERAWEIWNE